MKIIITEEQLNNLLNKCPDNQYYFEGRCVGYPKGSKTKIVGSEKEYNKMMKRAVAQSFYYNEYLKTTEINPQYIFGKSKNNDDLIQKFNISFISPKDLSYSYGNIQVKKGKLLPNTGQNEYLYNKFTDNVPLNIREFVIVQRADGIWNIIEYVKIPPTFPILQLPKPEPVKKIEPSNQNKQIQTTTEFTPKPDDTSVYGPSKSLIGFMRGRNFIPATGKYTVGMNKIDKDLLNNKVELNNYLRDLYMGYANPIQ